MYKFAWAMKNGVNGTRVDHSTSKQRFHTSRKGRVYKLNSAAKSYYNDYQGKTKTYETKYRLMWKGPFVVEMLKQLQKLKEKLRWDLGHSTTIFWCSEISENLTATSINKSVPNYLKKVIVKPFKESNRQIFMYLPFHVPRSKINRLN